MGATESGQLIDGHVHPGGVMTRFVRNFKGDEWVGRCDAKPSGEDWSTIYTATGTEEVQKCYDRYVQFSEAVLKIQCPEVFKNGPRAHREGFTVSKDGEIAKLNPPKPNAEMLHHEAEDIFKDDSDPFGFDDDDIPTIDCSEKPKPEWSVVFEKPGDPEKMLHVMVTLMGDDIELEELELAVDRICENDLQVIGCSTESAARELSSAMQAAGATTLVLKA